MLMSRSIKIVSHLYRTTVTNNIIISHHSHVHGNYYKINPFPSNTTFQAIIRFQHDSSLNRFFSTIETKYYAHISITSLLLFISFFLPRTARTSENCFSNLTESELKYSLRDETKIMGSSKLSSKPRLFRLSFEAKIPIR